MSHTALASSNNALMYLECDFVEICFSWARSALSFWKINCFWKLRWQMVDISLGTAGVSFLGSGADPTAQVRRYIYSLALPHPSTLKQLSPMTRNVIANYTPRQTHFLTLHPLLSYFGCENLESYSRFFSLCLILRHLETVIQPVNCF